MINFYLPDSPGFDSKIFIQFLSAEKRVNLFYNFIQLLPVGYEFGFEFNYFNKSHKFTKDHLLSFFNQDEELLKYLPDDISKSSINRTYLISVSLFIII